MATELDHLVVGTADLAAGEAWMTDMLGCPAQGGGEHETMGTHNKVWSLGSAYLELIAINPDVPAPPRRRWFALDDHTVQGRLAQGPHLLTWAVRVDDISATLEASPLPLGKVYELSRGDLSWRVAIPDDGELIQDGHVPLVIQWLTPSPSERLDDSGLRLERLLAHRTEPTTVRKVLAAIGADGLIEVEGGDIGTSLMAEIATGDGNISLVG